MNELYWGLMLLINFLLIMAAYRLWGRAGLYIWIPISVMLANIQVTKTVELFGLEATLGNIIYATSFLATDILSENYSRQDARRAVAIGFFAMITMTVLMNLAILFIPAESDFVQTSMITIFALMPRIAAASLLAYGISQMHDIFAYSWIKTHLPQKKFLWVRNNGSTLVSQLLDSLIFTFAAFWGLFPISVLIEILITTYVLKVVVSLFDTPFIYLARHWHDVGKISEAL